MPRYYFDFHEGPVYSSDTEGTDFPNVEQAYLEAYEAAQEMWSELLWERRDPRLCSFKVRTQARELLFTLPFQEVVDSCRNRPNQPLRRTFEQAASTSDYARRVSAEFRKEVSATYRALQESRALLAQEF